MRPTVLVAAAVLSAVTVGSSAAGNAAADSSRRPADTRTSSTGATRRAGPGYWRASARCSPGTSTLTGIVTTYAGQPAVGARIMVGGEGPSRMAMTDARGRFSVAALRAGRYYVTVSKPGYVTVTYGQRRVNSQGTPIPLGDGETRDIAMQLPRGGVITGMVLDERGEPAVNAFVRVMRFMPGAGERRPQQTGGDNTDDRGIYRVHSLQPGDYAVCATYRGSGPQNDAQRIQMEMDRPPPRDDQRAVGRRPPADGHPPGRAAGADAGAERAGDRLWQRLFSRLVSHRVDDDSRRCRRGEGRHRSPAADHPGGPHRGPGRRAAGRRAPQCAAEPDERRRGGDADRPAVRRNRRAGQVRVPVGTAGRLQNPGPLDAEASGTARTGCPSRATAAASVGERGHHGRRAGHHRPRARTATRRHDLWPSGDSLDRHAAAGGSQPGDDQRLSFVAGIARVDDDGRSAPAGHR